MVHSPLKCRDRHPEIASGQTATLLPVACQRSRRIADADLPRFSPLPANPKVSVYSAYPESVYLTRAATELARSWVGAGWAVWIKHGLSVRLLVHPASKVLNG